jgi:glutaminyl-peptide cyclotransferase
MSLLDATTPHSLWSRRRFLQVVGGGVVAAPLVAHATSSDLLARAALPLPVAGRLLGQEAQFNASRAWDDLVNQVNAGPRVPGMPGHDAVREYMLRELRGATDRVDVQDFVWEVRGTNLSMTNVFGVFGPDEPGKVVLAAHWDTRPWADQDPNPANHDTPIPGANDGASGVAVLLEIARVLQAAPPPIGVIILMLDGEDYGPGIDAMFLGSKYWAPRMVPERPAWGILLDMIGDRDLGIPREAQSQARAGAVNDRVWQAAQQLGRPEFLNTMGSAILDDHVMVLDQGVPMIDLIDFSYGPRHSWWHTLEDTPDKCSPDSLSAVGQVVLRTLYNAG